jgi:hypothetical protein
MCPGCSVIMRGLVRGGGRGHLTHSLGVITEDFWVYVSGMFRDHGDVQRGSVGRG